MPAQRSIYYIHLPTGYLINNTKNNVLWTEIFISRCVNVVDMFNRYA